MKRSSRSIPAITSDFLESSRLALDFAVTFAHHYGARLTNVHAFELEDALYDDRVRADVIGKDLIARILFLVQTVGQLRHGLAISRERGAMTVAWLKYVVRLA